MRIIIPTLDQALEPHLVNLTDEQQAALKRDLLAREDLLRDALQIAGVQFGLYAEIVAEVLAELRFGSPFDEVTRQMIRSNFVTLMNTLREQGDQG